LHHAIITLSYPTLSYLLVSSLINLNSEAEGDVETATGSDNNVPEEERMCGAELHALRMLFLLLSINTISKNSGQYLASGAIQIADFPIIGTYTT
jgi:hypothetical protein